jgi:putative transposase
LLSDNGPAFIAEDLKAFLNHYHLEHIRSAPFHPMTQGKIERFHRSMKNVIRLDNHYLPWHLEQAIKEFMEYYNEQRYHESLGNVTPADMYFGRATQIQARREQLKEKTMRERRRLKTTWQERAAVSPHPRGQLTSLSACTTS